MAVYGVFESCNMGSTHYAERIFDCVCTKDVENGTFGYFETLAEGFSHVYTFVPGYKAGATMVVVDQPAWDEDECRLTNQNRDQFVVKAGDIFRVRVVKHNDEFAVNKACFTSASANEVKVGAFVSVDTATGKLVAAAIKPGEQFVGTIMRKRMLGNTIVTKAHTYGNAQEMFTVRVAG